MSTQKRGRACDACHTIKIKCELGSGGGNPPCERCTRLNKDCVLTPAKSHKDRVAELEAKVEALTKLLETQGLVEDASQVNPSSRPLANACAEPEIGDAAERTDAGIGKKRKIDEAARPWLDATAFGTSATLPLDFIVPIGLQAQILHKYTTEMAPKFPVVPLSQDCSLEVMRATRPALLQTIMFVASPGSLPSDARERVAQLLMDQTSYRAMLTNEKTLELLQVLEVAALWFWLPKNHQNVAPFHFIDLAHDVALSAGLAQSKTIMSFASALWGAKHETAEPWRGWLVCYMLSATWSLFQRRLNSHIWTLHHEECLGMLEHSPNALKSDHLLCQFVRAERMCELVASAQAFADMTNVIDISSSEWQLRLLRLQQLVQDWKTQIPGQLRVPTLMLWQYLVELYLHEPVLHTPSNKQSFAAPFVAERLSSSDFPAPLPTRKHVTSLLALCKASHGFIDVFCGLDTTTIVALPGLLFPTRALYAVFILVKMHIALTAPGNTYGSIFTLADLQLEDCFLKIDQVAARIKRVDGKAVSFLVLSAASRLREWVKAYQATMPERASGLANTLSSEPVIVGSSGLDDFGWNMVSGAAYDFPAGDNLQHFSFDAGIDWSLAAIPESPCDKEAVKHHGLLH